MDSRCFAALHGELDPGESVLHVCFQRSFVRRVPRWLFVRKEELAARLVALTNRRLLMATEGEHEIQDRYGVRLRTAPLDYLREVQRTKEDGRALFTFRFAANAAGWKLWLREEDERAMDSIILALGCGFNTRYENTSLSSGGVS